MNDQGIEGLLEAGAELSKSLVRFLETLAKACPQQNDSAPERLNVPLARAEPDGPVRADDFLDLPPRMDAATLAGLLPDTSAKTLERWRSLGQGPTYVKCAGKIYYLRSDVVVWMLASRKERANNR
ncbi:hypothetical protein GCM10009693_20780 [Leucobacter chromiireducens subsp. chromiireducens]